MGIRQKISDFIAKINSLIEAKKKEKDVMREIRREARIQAYAEIQPELKEAYKKELKDKMTGNSKGKQILEKMAKSFKESSLGDKSKIDMMLGRRTGFEQQPQAPQQAPLPSQDRIANLMGGRATPQPQAPQQEYYTEQEEQYYEEPRPRRVRRPQPKRVRRPRPRPQPQQQAPLPSQDRIASLMGRGISGSAKEDERERIKRLLR